jgi:hypothetical protein
MSTGTRSAQQAHRMQIAEAELAALVQACGLQPGASSPLPQSSAAAADSGTCPREWLDDPALMRALHLLAQADISLQQRRGGPLQEYALACACLQPGSREVAELSPGASSTWNVALYADTHGFVDHWLDSHASAADQDIANALPPPLSLATITLMLHAIDAYRRASYQSALAYATEPLSISVAEFTHSLGAAAASTDLRWLLPSFLQLLPGIDPSSLIATDQDLAALAEHDLLTLQSGKGEQRLGFGATGHWIGAEFLRSWHQAVGFELNLHRRDDRQTLARVLLAPTALSNHWFELSADGREVNHQPLRVSVLAQRLDDLLDQALAVASAATAATAPLHCPQCHEPVSAGARFCGACGAPLKAPGRGI